jgi:hypothetical protein
MHQQANQKYREVQDDGRVAVQGGTEWGFESGLYTPGLAF